MKRSLTWLWVDYSTLRLRKAIKQLLHCVIVNSEMDLFSQPTEKLLFFSFPYKSNIAFKGCDKSECFIGDKGGCRWSIWFQLLAPVMCTHPFPLKLPHDPRDVTDICVPNHTKDNILLKQRNVQLVKWDQGNWGLVEVVFAAFDLLRQKRLRTLGRKEINV